MLNLKPLCTAIVDVAPPLAVGATPWGNRAVGEIRAVTISGDRMTGKLEGAAAADWISVGGAVGIIDVRMTVRTDDGALILVTYGGRLDLARPGGPVATVAPTFATGDERYAWLNAVQAIGRGALTADASGSRLSYEFYEVL